MLDGHEIGGLREQESIPDEDAQWLLGLTVITLDELDRFKPSMAAEDGAHSLQDLPVVQVSSEVAEEEGLGSPLATRAEAVHHLVGEPLDVDMSILAIDEGEGVLFGSLLVVLGSRVPSLASEATIASIALVDAIHLGVGVEPTVRLGFDGVGGEGGVGQETRPTLLHRLVLAAARLAARHLVDVELLFGVVSPGSLGSGLCWENDGLVWTREEGEEDSDFVARAREGEKVKGREWVWQRRLVAADSSDSSP